MKRTLAILLMTAMLTGCTAEMMETRGGNIQLIHLPTEKTGKGGVIRYLNTGMSSWKDARRKNAEKQMKDFCKGAYTITAEGPRSKFGASMPIGSHSSVEVDQYTYLAFDCSQP